VQFTGVVADQFLELSQQALWTGPGDITTVTGGGSKCVKNNAEHLFRRAATMCAVLEAPW
jgi:hypothetical protein